MSHKNHELSNEVLYDPVPQGVSKIQDVKVSTLTCCIFDTPFGTGSNITSLKRYGIYERRGLSCGRTSSIPQDVMKSDNLLHKQGFAVAPLGL